MIHHPKSESGTIIIQLVTAIIAIVLMAMLANYMATWSAWDLLGAAVIATVLIFFGFITVQSHFNY